MIEDNLNCRTCSITQLVLQLQCRCHCLPFLAVRLQIPRWQKHGQFTNCLEIFEYSHYKLLHNEVDTPAIPHIHTLIVPQTFFPPFFPSNVRPILVVAFFWAEPFFLHIRILMQAYAFIMEPLVFTFWIVACNHPTKWRTMTKAVCGRLHVFIFVLFLLIVGFPVRFRFFDCNLLQTLFVHRFIFEAF